MNIRNKKTYNINMKKNNISKIHKLQSMIDYCFDAIFKKYGYISIRNFDQFLVNHFDNKYITGVEIGVYKGGHADILLKSCNINKLYLVDPYCSYDNYVNGWGEHITDDEFITIKKDIKNFLKDYIDNIEFVVMFSEFASEAIPYNLDFVYIDANHKFDFVKKDIEVWYTHIHSGGVIGGHNFEIDQIGVIEAVLEFANKMDIKIMGGGVDWWMIKP